MINMVELMYKSHKLAQVYICHSELFEIYGDYVEYPIMSKYEEFFETLICEEGFDNSQFDDELLNAENWFLCDDGKMIGIECPALYKEDHSIYIRFR